MINDEDNPEDFNGADIDNAKQFNLKEIMAEEEKKEDFKTKHGFGMRDIKDINCKMLLLYGPTKVGKSAMCSQLEDALIFDFEDGYRPYKAHIREIENLGNKNGDNIVEDDKSLLYTLSELSKWKKEDPKGFPYTYGIIDTIDMLEGLQTERVIRNYNIWVDKVFNVNPANDKKKKEKANTLNEAYGGYGAGQAEVQKKIQDNLRTFRKIFDRVIIIGHLNKKLYGETKVEINSDDLALTGSTKIMLMAECDSIGSVFRDKDDNLMISFKGTEFSLAGSRQVHLAGKVIPFDWKQIYI